MDTPAPRRVSPVAAALPVAAESLRLALEQGIAPRLVLEQALREGAATERQRLARVLHDTVAQCLTAIYFHAKGIETQLGRDDSETTGKMTFLGEMIQQASAELNEIIRGLAPDGTHPPGEE